MACPFFEPRLPLEPGHWTSYWLHRPRLPLGEAYSGVCHAGSSPPHTPPEDRQRELCNCGYARGVCDRFPADAPGDAVRFSVIQEEPLRLVYILEKDHAPSEHRVLDFAAATGGTILCRQVWAFVTSYRRQQSSELPAQSSSASSPG